MAVLNKSQLLAKMRATYVSGGNITAKQVREYQKLLIDAIFAGSSFVGLELEFSGTTLQNDNFIGINEADILLFNKGLEVSTSIGTTFDSATGTFTFPLSRSGEGKAFYKEPDNAFTGVIVDLSGTTYQNDNLIGLNPEDIMLFNKGIEIASTEGTVFDSNTGSFTFPLSRTGKAKLFYK